jgi:flagellar basal body-associated protein FliL
LGWAAVTLRAAPAFDGQANRRHTLSILWIILIIVLVLLLLGFFSRGRW